MDREAVEKLINEESFDKEDQAKIKDPWKITLCNWRTK